MLKYRFNVGDGLERAGFNTYKAKNKRIIESRHAKEDKERRYKYKR